MKDLTTPKGVIELMRSSRTAEQWDKNCDAVKEANGGNYPPFWYKEIILGGVYAEMRLLYF